MENLKTPLSEQYKNHLRGCLHPCFSVLLAIDGITECPNQKKEILEVLGQKIREFGISNLGQMQTTISDLERILSKEEVKRFNEKRLNSCQDVNIFLATTALKILDSASG